MKQKLIEALIALFGIGVGVFAAICVYNCGWIDGRDAGRKEVRHEIYEEERVTKKSYWDDTWKREEEENERRRASGEKF